MRENRRPILNGPALIANFKPEIATWFKEAYFKQVEAIRQQDPEPAHRGHINHEQKTRYNTILSNPYRLEEDVIPIEILPEGTRSRREQKIKEIQEKYRGQRVLIQDDEDGHLKLYDSERAWKDDDEVIFLMSLAPETETSTDRLQKMSRDAKGMPIVINQGGGRLKICGFSRDGHWMEEAIHGVLDKDVANLFPVSRHGSIGKKIEKALEKFDPGFTTLLLMPDTVHVKRLGSAPLSLSSKKLPETYCKAGVIYFDVVKTETGKRINYRLKTKNIITGSIKLSDKTLTASNIMDDPALRNQIVSKILKQHQIQPLGTLALGTIIRTANLNNFFNYHTSKLLRTPISKTISHSKILVIGATDFWELGMPGEATPQEWIKAGEKRGVTVEHYQVPVTDHTAQITEEAILAAVYRMRQCLEESPNNTVYVHCKSGKGRSAMIAAAYTAIYGASHGIQFIDEHGKTIQEPTAIDATKHVKSQRQQTQLKHEQFGNAGSISRLFDIKGTEQIQLAQRAIELHKNFTDDLKNKPHPTTQDYVTEFNEYMENRRWPGHGKTIDHGNTLAFKNELIQTPEFKALALVAADKRKPEKVRKAIQACFDAILAANSYEAINAASQTLRQYDVAAQNKANIYVAYVVPFCKSLTPLQLKHQYGLNEEAEIKLEKGKNADEVIFKIGDKLSITISSNKISVNNPVKSTSKEDKRAIAAALRDIYTLDPLVSTDSELFIKGLQEKISRNIDGEKNLNRLLTILHTAMPVSTQPTQKPPTTVSKTWEKINAQISCAGKLQACLLNADWPKEKGLVKISCNGNAYNVPRFVTNILDALQSGMQATSADRTMEMALKKAATVILLEPNHEAFFKRLLPESPSAIVDIQASIENIMQEIERSNFSFKGSGSEISVINADGTVQQRKHVPRHVAKTYEACQAVCKQQNITEENLAGILKIAKHQRGFNLFRDAVTESFYQNIERHLVLDQKQVKALRDNCAITLTSGKTPPQGDKRQLIL